MKITLDAQLLFEKEKTGIGIMATEIIDRISAIDDYEITLAYFSFYKKKQREEIIQKYIKRGCIIKKCRWFPLAIYKRIWNAFPIPYSGLMREKSDIVQFYNYDLPPGIKGKSLVYVHDMTYMVYPDMVSRKTKKHLDKNLLKSCSRADVIVTVSEFSKKQIIKYLNIPSEKICVVPCGVNVEQFQLNYNNEYMDKVLAHYRISGDYILYLGTLEPRKNIERMIEGYALACKSSSDMPKLILAGKKGWFYESVFAKVKELNISENVIFTGYIKQEDKIVLMKRAKAFVFLPLYEGFGIPPLEALACGTPALVSDIEPITEIVGDAAIVVDPCSIESISLGMKLIIKEEQQLDAMREKRVNRAKLYSWDYSVLKLFKIYNHLYEGVPL